MNKILYGDIVKQEWLKNIKVQIDSLGIKPTLAVIQVGDDEASNKYIKNKIKACSQVGIDVKYIKVHYADITQYEMLEKIEKLNDDKNVNGIIVQLPLPPQLDPVEIGETILPIKDVDGFNSVNVGRLLLGDEDLPYLISCTPLGIMHLLDYYHINLNGKNVVIIGRSNIVGKPLTSLMINRGATVTVCNSHTKDITNYTFKADIVVTAVGKPKIFKASKFLHGQILIDVGINFDENGKLCGDIDKEDVLNTLNNIQLAPSPRGVGQTTVGALMYNTVVATLRQLEN